MILQHCESYRGSVLPVVFCSLDCRVLNVVRTRRLDVFVSRCFRWDSKITRNGRKCATRNRSEEPLRMSPNAADSCWGSCWGRWFVCRNPSSTPEPVLASGRVEGRNGPEGSASRRNATWKQTAGAMECRGLALCERRPTGPGNSQCEEKVLTNVDQTNGTKKNRNYERTTVQYETEK